ncbi:hypothetical protein AB0M48_07560 [Lentzea sp. NPDC051208]|uniref:hypothetical protein n=1 Tax=Lentzea sp. NPDC051208 TaxID=3154642 RepID=UPI003445526E
MTYVLDQLPADLAITPRAVAGFLAVSGWSLDSGDEISELWSLREGSTTRAQIRLPLDQTFVDFDRRFDIVLKRLSLFHDWDYFQLASSVLGTKSDLLYIRADQLIRYDSIPLKQAEQLISGTAKLLTAAAWSTIERRANYTGRRPDIVRNFVEEEVRMGHTQRGSFILTVITRLDEDETIVPEQAEPLALSAADSTAIEAPDVELLRETLKSSGIVTNRTAYEERQREELAIPPFQRRVMSTLASALRTTARLASEDSLAGLDSAVDSGVSAMLCDSLDEMTRFAGLRTLDLNFKWAPAVSREHPAIERVTFGRDQIPRLINIRDRLRERPDIERATVFGRVTKLERSDQSDDADEAMVTVRGVFERNRERVFKVRLAGAEHDLAIRAYREQFPIAITGDIDRRKRSFTFEGNIAIESMRE